MTIRPATPADAGALAALAGALSRFFLADPERPEDAAAFLATMTPAAFAERLADPRFRYLLAEEEGELAGLVALRDGTHLYHLFVAERFHRRGVATRLWEAALAAAGHPDRVTVNASRFAVPVYRRIGFTATAPEVQKDGIAFLPMLLGPVWETERLRARRMSLDDLDFLAGMLGSEEVMRHYPKPLTRDEARGWVERQMERYAEHGHGLWLVEEHDGTPVGQVGLILQTVDGRLEPEVAYLLDRRFWGRRYATEAAAATRDWAFRVRADPYVISLIRPANLPSQAVARRIGMVPVRSTTTHAGLEHLVFRADAPAPP